MLAQQIEVPQGNVWFVYDGECPLCKRAASAFQVKKAVGNLHLIDARKEKTHPVVTEINQRKLDLDDGMVVKYGDQFYHGDEALHIMALLGSSHGLFNRLNALLFKSKKVAKFSYPFMRSIRNLLIRIQGINKINNLYDIIHEPIFKQVFAEKWDALPSVIHQHYALRPFSDDKVKITGHLNIRVSRFVSFMSKLTGKLLSTSGDNIPVTVVLANKRSPASIYFDRIFHFPDKGDIIFCSRMDHLKDNVVIEYIGFGIGWKAAFDWDGKTVSLSHQGYVWRAFGFIIPLPLSLLLGQGHAEKTALSDPLFSFKMYVKHSLFGKTFGYSGKLKIIEISCSKKF